MILRGQILVRRSGDLLEGSIMAPIQSIDVYQCVFLFKTIRFMIDSSLQDLKGDAMNLTVTFQNNILGVSL